jgi:hypothetical protein
MRLWIIALLAVSGILAACTATSPTNSPINKVFPTKSPMLTSTPFPSQTHNPTPSQTHTTRPSSTFTYTTTTAPTPLTPLLPTWTVTPEGASDLEMARHTLLTFFTLLHEGRYAKTIPLYGGTYDSMRSNNPEIPPDDYAALWEAACTVQRPACLLVANIVEEESVAQDEYKFSVEFIWIDGSLFKLGPCCGATETEMPPVWQFPYTVRRIDGQFKVMEEPVYMP